VSVCVRDFVSLCLSVCERESIADTISLFACQCVCVCVCMCVRVSVSVSVCLTPDTLLLLLLLLLLLPPLLLVSLLCLHLLLSRLNSYHEDR
jgi:hypothetical protein